MSTQRFRNHRCALFLYYPEVCVCVQRRIEVNVATNGVDLHHFNYIGKRLSIIINIQMFASLVCRSFATHGREKEEEHREKSNRFFLFVEYLSVSAIALACAHCCANCARLERSSKIDIFPTNHHIGSGIDTIKTNVPRHAFIRLFRRLLYTLVFVRSIQFLPFHLAVSSFFPRTSSSSSFYYYFTLRYYYSYYYFACLSFADVCVRWFFFALLGIG